jgi:hypothetical protein
VGLFFALNLGNTMLILKDPPQLPSTIDPDLLKLITLRLTQLAPTLPHQIIIVEPLDTVEDLETITGQPILTNLFDDVRYPDPDFVPCCEVLEDHGYCYEMVFIFSDADDSEETRQKTSYNISTVITGAINGTQLKPGRSVGRLM